MVTRYLGPICSFGVTDLPLEMAWSGEGQYFIDVQKLCEAGPQQAELISGEPIVFLFVCWAYKSPLSKFQKAA